MAHYKPTFLRILILFLNVVAVVILFRVIADKKIAATVAGLTFVGTSSLLVWQMHRLRPLGSAIHYRSLTFWICGAFLLLIAIPMVSVRILNWSTEFSELFIWGLPGPDFHQLSSKFFSLQLLAVAVDGLISFLDQKKKTRSS